MRSRRSCRNFSTTKKFRGRPYSNSKKNTAQFWKNVQVLHLPCPRHDAAINLDEILAVELPENALHIRCGKLKVLENAPGSYAFVRAS